MSDADIRQFIARCTGETTSRVAPWLNCGTDAELADLLRRCVVDGIVSNAVKVVYPEAAAYLNAEHVFGDEALEEYFKVYRELKMVDRVTPEFYERAQRVIPPSSVQSRDAMVQRYASDNDVRVAGGGRDGRGVGADVGGAGTGAEYRRGFDSGR